MASSGAGDPRLPPQDPLPPPGDPPESSPPPARDPLPPPPPAPEPLPTPHTSRGASASLGASPVPEAAAPSELASIGSRVAARALDTALKAIAAIGAVVIVALALWEWLIEGFSLWGDSEPFPASGVWALIAAGVILVAIPIYEIAMVAVRGQTIGKRVANIKVVCLHSDSPPGWGRAIGRWFLPVAAFWSAALFLSLLSTILQLASVGPPVGLVLGRVTQLLAAGLWLAVRLSAIWGPDRRGWHDRLAGTRVVKA